MGSDILSIGKSRSRIVAEGETGVDFSAAIRGTLMLALDPNAVGDGNRFISEVERIISASRSLHPLPGEERAEVAGSLEWQREREWSQRGIPLKEDHRRMLETLADEVGTRVPWQRG